MEKQVRVMPIDQQDRTRREDALRMTPEERVNALLQLRDRMFPPAPFERNFTIRSLPGFGGVGVPELAFLSPGTAITLGAQPNQIDLLTSMGPRPTQEIIANAIEGKIGEPTVPIVSFDDLLHAKKASDRAKDRIDAEELERIHRS